jgi:sugar/nucleoside kinase (ribokinase family)
MSMSLPKHDSQLDLLAFGDLMADHYYAAPRPPELGGKRQARYLGAFGGGMAGNLTRVAAALGLRAAVVAGVGADQSGRALTAELAGAGVGTALISVGDEATGRTVITLLPDGERTILLAPGGHVGRALSDLTPLRAARPRLVYLNSVELARAASLAQACVEAGLALVCDLEEHEVRLDVEAARAVAARSLLVACSPRVAELLGPRRPGSLRLLLAGAQGLRLQGDAGEQRFAPAPGPVTDTTGGGVAAVAGCCRALLEAGVVGREGEGKGAPGGGAVTASAGEAALAAMGQAAIAAAAGVVARLGVGGRLDL